MGIANIVSRQNWYDNVNGNGSRTDQTNAPGSPGTDGNASIVLTAGKRYIALMLSHATTASALSSLVFDVGGADEVAFSLIAGSALTWDAGVKRAELWELNCTATTGAKAFTVTWAASVSSSVMLLFEFDGEDDAGTYVQVVTNSGTGTSASVAMSAFGATDNAMFLFVSFSDQLKTIAATESRTELTEWNDAERLVAAIDYQNPNGGDTSCDATSTSDTWVAIGLEVKAGAAAAGAEIGLPETKPFTVPLMGGYF